MRAGRLFDVPAAVRPTPARGLRSAIAITAAVVLALHGTAVPAAQAAPPAPIDLGTLGGVVSSAVAVSGNIVVGSARNTAGVEHAFALDLGATAPAMKDLGTLGGEESYAVAVSGPLVVGYSYTAGDTVTHAFTYDTAAMAPAMRDLGTLGGSESEASAVAGSKVVGFSYLPGDVDTHAFVYDVAAAAPAMRDLGTLGGTISFPTAIAGSLVVGYARTAGDTEIHAFAYDLAAVTPVMRDLGTLGGDYSEATAASGNIVVGASRTAAGEMHAFSIDLGATAPVMRDLGTLGGTASRATAVSGTLVVGNAAVVGASTLHAFAYDLAAATPSMRDLGTFGGEQSRAVGLSGKVVVGYAATTAGFDHAFAYDLAAASPALQDLGTLGGSVSRATAVSGSIAVGEAFTAQANGHAAAWRLTVTLTPPGAPTGVSAVAAAGGAVVSWTPPAETGGSPITGYTAVASPGGATCATAGALGCGITGLMNGTAYTLTVTAANIAGSGRPSAPSVAVVPTATAPPVPPQPPAPPVVPTKVPGMPVRVAAMRGHLSAVIVWAPPLGAGAGITSYRVVASPGGRACATKGAVRCTVTGLVNGRSYAFTVTATNAVGTGRASTASAGIVPAPVPGVPARVRVVRGNRGVTVLWSAPAANGAPAVTGYRVVASPGGARCTVAQGLRCAVTGLVNGRSYSFGVVAINRVGAGPSTEAVVGKPATVPTPVRTLAAAFPMTNRTVLSWAAPAANGGQPIGRYEFRTSADNGRTWSRWTSVAMFRSAAVNGWRKGRVYLAEVCAINAVGPGTPARLVVKPPR